MEIQILHVFSTNRVKLKAMYRVRWSMSEGNLKHQGGGMDNTLPLYRFFIRTSGAMYAGVPTVDFGCECRRDDCKKKSENSMTVNQVNEAQVVLFFNSYQTTTVQQ